MDIKKLYKNTKVGDCQKNIVKQAKQGKSIIKSWKVKKAKLFTNLLWITYTHVGIYNAWLTSRCRPGDFVQRTIYRQACRVIVIHTTIAGASAILVKYSPIGGVLVINYNTQCRVAKYTLCDVGSMFGFGALLPYFWLLNLWFARCARLQFNNSYPALPLPRFVIIRANLRT